MAGKYANAVTIGYAKITHSNSENLVSDQSDALPAQVDHIWCLQTRAHTDISHTGPVEDLCTHSLFAGHCASIAAAHLMH